MAQLLFEFKRLDLSCSSNEVGLTFLQILPLFNIDITEDQNNSVRLIDKSFNRLSIT